MPSRLSLMWLFLIENFPADQQEAYKQKKDLPFSDYQATKMIQLMKI